MRAWLKRFAECESATATIELGLGMVVVITVSALAFDLYSRIGAQGTVGQAAIAMAEYTAIDPAPERNEMQALTEVFHDEVIGVPSDLSITVSLIQKGTAEPDPPIRVVWSDRSFESGDQAAAITETCARVAKGNNTVTWPEEFTEGMREGEAAIVSEACAKLRREGSITGRFVGGEIYRLHIAPVRDLAALPRPPA